MDELKALKKILDSHRLSNPKLKKFPSHFWPRVIQLTQHIPPNEIANFLNIDLANLNQRVRGSALEKISPEKMPIQQFLQVPIDSVGPSGKHVILSLPHNITIRIEL